MRPEGVQQNPEITRIYGERRIPNRPVLIGFASEMYVAAPGAIDPGSGYRTLSLFLDRRSGGRSINTGLFESVTVGRDRGTNLVVINNEAISRNHAQLSRDRGGRWSIRDMNSLNGTFMDRILEIPQTEEMITVPEGEWVYLPTPDPTTDRVNVVFGSHQDVGVLPAQLMRTDVGAALHMPNYSRILPLYEAVNIGSQDTPDQISIPGLNYRHATVIALEDGFLLRDRSRDGILVQRDSSTQDRPSAVQHVLEEGVAVAIERQRGIDFAETLFPTVFTEKVATTVKADKLKNWESVSLADAHYLAVFDGDKPKKGNSASAITASKIWEVMSGLPVNSPIADVQEAIRDGLYEASEEMANDSATSASIVYLTRFDRRRFAVIAHAGTTRVEVVKYDGRVQSLTVDQGRAYADGRDRSQEEVVDRQKSKGQITNEANLDARFIMEQVDQVENGEIHLAGSLGEYWHRRGDAYFTINRIESEPTFSVYEIQDDDAYIMCSSSGVTGALTPAERIGSFRSGETLEERVRAVAEDARATTGLREMRRHASLAVGKL